VRGGVQHRCATKALISSGDAKITSARSPVIPAGTRAGAPFLRTVVADVGLEAQIALPEIARLPVGGGDIVGVAAMADGPYPVLRVERLEIGHLAAAHGYFSATMVNT
jgi:hypothetical protein